ncbi:MAG: hypothetical protein AAGK92_03690 [Pseudomonadota bacterium]
MPLSRIFTIFISALLCATSAPATTYFVEQDFGDHFVFEPSGDPQRILVVAHARTHSDLTYNETAKFYLDQWVDFAEKHSLLLVAPVFDTDRFGNDGGGAGGYRLLFGKYVDADDFVLFLADKYQDEYSISAKQFLLYGHYVGAQFALRFVARHPDVVEKTVVTSPIHFTYPYPNTPWPWGAGAIEEYLKWNDGTVQKVEEAGNLKDYAKAAGKTHVIAGEKDEYRDKPRPAHEGLTRPLRAISWLIATNRNAHAQGEDDLASYRIIPNASARSDDLLPHAKRYFETKVLSVPNTD